MKKELKISYFLLVAVLFSCTQDKTEANLMTGERKFIHGLGILDLHEQVEMFECNGGFEDVTQSGNFITPKRIASYWIEDGEQEIHSAAFATEIDSISQTDLLSNPSYASYLTVYKTDGSSFKVYIDADSARTYRFFNKARSNWEKCTTNK